MKEEYSSALVNKIIKRYGPVIDLRTHPEVIIDIMRRFDEPPDGGTPCGGVPSPPPPPSPSMVGERVTNDEILKAVLALSRQVSAIRKSLPAAAKKRSR